MTYRTEFPDYDPASMPAVPAEWADQSWHNDTCPNFVTPNGWRVWADYAAPELREVPESPRFSVQPCRPDGDHVMDDAALSSDDWSEVLAFVATPAAEWLENEGDTLTTAATHAAGTEQGAVLMHRAQEMFAALERLVGEV